MCIDWIVCLVLANIIVALTSQLGSVSTVTLMLFLLLGIVSVALFGRTPGHAVLGMGVARVDVRTERVGLWRSVVRSLLTVAIFPAVLVDADGRGMHDRATGTAVVRS